MKCNVSRTIINDQIVIVVGVQHMPSAGRKPTLHPKNELTFIQSLFIVFLNYSLCGGQDFLKQMCMDVSMHEYGVVVL